MYIKNIKIVQCFINTFLYCDTGFNNPFDKHIDIYRSLNISNGLHFVNFKSIFPINKLDLDFAPKNLCATFG